MNIEAKAKAYDALKIENAALEANVAVLKDACTKVLAAMAEMRVVLIPGEREFMRVAEAMNVGVAAAKAAGVMEDG